MEKAAVKTGRTLGINGFGRIGKLSLWFNAASKRFDHIVVNPGREIGRGLEDVAQ